MSVFGDLGSRDLPFKLILRTTAHLFFFSPGLHGLLGECSKVDTTARHNTGS